MKMCVFENQLTWLKRKRHGRNLARVRHTSIPRLAKLDLTEQLLFLARGHPRKVVGLRGRQNTPGNIRRWILRPY